jgi:hypothetical protein
MTTGTATKIAKAVKCIEPDAYVASTVNGPAIELKGYGQALFVLECGALGTSATIDLKIQESPDGSTGWVDITGAALGQKAQGTDDDKVFQGSVGAMGVASSRLGWVRAVLTVGVATSDVAVSCVLLDPQIMPTSPQEAEVDDTFVVA